MTNSSDAQSARSAAPDSGAKKAARVYGGKTSEERQAERYKALIDALFEIVGGEGYAAATVRAICKRAGLSERYFYESFESREAILNALYDSIVHEGRTRVLEAISAVTVEELEAAKKDPSSINPIILAGTRAYSEFFTQEPYRANVVVIDATSVPANREGLSVGSSYSFSDLIGELLNTLLGYEHPLAKVCGIGMVGYFSRVLSWWYVEGQDKDASFLSESTAIVFQGMLDRMSMDQPDHASTPNPSIIAAKIGSDRKRGMPLNPVDGSKKDAETN